MVRHRAKCAHADRPPELNSAIHAAVPRVPRGATKPHAGLDPTRVRRRASSWTSERALRARLPRAPGAVGQPGPGRARGRGRDQGLLPAAHRGQGQRGRPPEYAPTAGIKSLRAAVARLYNEHPPSTASRASNSWENVAIVPGGRAGLNPQLLPCSGRAILHSSFPTTPRTTNAFVVQELRRHPGSA